MLAGVADDLGLATYWPSQAQGDGRRVGPKRDGSRHTTRAVAPPV